MTANANQINKTCKSDVLYTTGKKQIPKVITNITSSYKEFSSFATINRNGSTINTFKKPNPIQPYCG